MTRLLNRLVVLGLQPLQTFRHGASLRDIIRRRFWAVVLGLSSYASILPIGYISTRPDLLTTTPIKVQYHCSLHHSYWYRGGLRAPDALCLMFPKTLLYGLFSYWWGIL